MAPSFSPNSNRHLRKKLVDQYGHSCYNGHLKEKQAMTTEALLLVERLRAHANNQDRELRSAADEMMWQAAPKDSR